MLLLLMGGNALYVLILFFLYQRLPPQLPLFYSQQWGETQLGEQWMILIFPILMNGYIILNYFIQKKVFKDNLLVKKMLYYFNIGVIICTLAIFVKIILTIT